MNTLSHSSTSLALPVMQSSSQVYALLIGSQRRTDERIDTLGDLLSSSSFMASRSVDVRRPAASTRYREPVELLSSSSALTWPRSARTCRCVTGVCFSAEAFEMLSSSSFKASRSADVRRERFNLLLLSLLSDRVPRDRCHHRGLANWGTKRVICTEALTNELE